MGTVSGTFTLKVVNSVLRVLSKKNPVSTWIVCDGRSEKAFHFAAGSIEFYASAGRRFASLEQLIAREHVVPRDRLNTVVVKSAGGDRALMETLESTGVLSGEELQPFLEELVFRELCDLVTWENAVYEFYDGEPLRPLASSTRESITVRADVRELARRARAWLAEWDQFARQGFSESARPAVSVPEDETSTGPEVSPALGVLLPFINGERSVREVARASGCPIRDAVHALSEGCASGCLRLQPVATLRAEPEILAEIEAGEGFLREAISPELVHARISELYEGLGNLAAASQQRVVAAAHQLQAGAADRAFESFRRALDLCPGNLEAHDRMVRVLLAGDDTEAGFSEAFVFARKLVAHGLPEAAVQYLRGLTRKAPRRLDVRCLLAEILEQTEKRSEAVSEYLEIVRLKREQGADRDLEEDYRRILAIEPGHKRVRALLHTEIVRRTGRKTLWLSRACAWLAVVLSLAWISSESLARYTWAREEPLVVLAVADGDTAAARRRLRETAELFPGNLLIGELLEREEKFYRRSFDRYEREIANAMELSVAGECLAAIESLARVAASAPVAAQRERAQELLEDVETFRESWLKMRRRAEALLKASFRPEAFVICRQVIENYPEGAEGMQIPYLIQSRTPGARVKVDGELWGYTPLWVFVRYGESPRIEVQLTGYPPATITDLQSRETLRVEVDLAAVDR